MIPAGGLGLRPQGQFEGLRKIAVIIIPLVIKGDCVCVFVHAVYLSK